MQATNSIHTFFSLLIGSTFILFCSSIALSQDISIEELWENSPHADASSESFTHWDDEGTVPSACANCHSGTGFQDYIGDDGSAVNQIDKDHPTGSLVECSTCHNGTTQQLDTVLFPSGVEIDNIESSVQCMVCHQGRSSTPSVDEKLVGISDDTVDESLGFINVHYRAAAATLYGAEVQGGYQYEGKTYMGRFDHVPGYSTCTGCHDAHSTEVKANSCASCHTDDAELSAIRMTAGDFNGNGNTSEGIADEIASLREELNTAINLYASEVIGKPVVYGPGKYPYFFNDLNANRTADADETSYPNRYQNWTPRLIKAAYNYQFALVDTGGYAHNPTYLLQLLYDSLTDLSSKVDVDLTDLTRP